jgi:hypothetical protein
MNQNFIPPTTSPQVRCRPTKYDPNKLQFGGYEMKHEDKPNKDNFFQNIVAYTPVAKS